MIENFTDQVPDEFEGFNEAEEQRVPHNELGEFSYLKSLASAATGEPAKIGEVSFNATIDDAFKKVSEENNLIDSQIATKAAQQGDVATVQQTIENIRQRNEQVEGLYKNRIKEVQDIALAAAEKTIAASPKVVLNNPPAKMAQKAQEARNGASYNAVMEMITQKASSKLGIAGTILWGFNPVSVKENYNLAQYVNSIYGEDTLNPYTSFSYESIKELRGYYATLTDDEKTTFIENTYNHFKDTWATTSTGAAQIVMDILQDEEPGVIMKALSQVGHYAAPAALLFNAAGVLKGARNVGTAMKMSNVEHQLATVGAKDVIVANAARNLGTKGVAQIVGNVTGVTDIIDTAKLVTMTSAKVLPTSITTAVSGVQDVIKGKVDALVADLSSTIRASNIRDGEEARLLASIEERYNPAYNKEIHSYHPAGPDGELPKVLYKPANDTSFITQEAAEIALKARDPKGILGLKVVPDTTNSGYKVDEVVLNARKAQRDALEVEYAALQAKATKAAGKVEVRSQNVPSPMVLTSAKPRYKTFPLQFASDLDKAVYQLGSKTAPSKTDPEVFNYVKESLGIKTDKGVQSFITNHRKHISEYLAKTTKGLSGGDVRVPEFKATSVDTPKAQLKGVEKALEEKRKEIAFLDEQIGAMHSANNSITQGWLIEQRVSASPLYKELGAYTQDDINNMVRFSLGDWALGTSSELYANRVVGLHQSSRYQKLLTEFVRKPLEGLNKKQKIQLNDVLVNGDKQGKEFTDDVLTLMGLDEKTRVAYYTVRALRNAMYTMRNNEAVKSLTGKGYKSLKMPFALDEPASVFGRVAEKQYATGKRVFNARTNSATSVDDAEMADQIVYELWTPVSIGGKEYKFVAVSPSLVKETPITEVIPYRPGEFKRSYSDPYFVKIRKDRDIDGTVEQGSPITHRTAATKTDADKYVKALTEAQEAFRKGELTLEKAAKMQPYGWQPEELIDAFQTGKLDGKVEVLFTRTDDDYLESMRSTGGSMFTRERGGHIKDIYGNDTNTLSPVDSLAAEISNTSYMVPMTEWRDVAVHRWYNTAKGFLPPEAQNMPPEQAFYYMVNNKNTYVGNDREKLFAQRVQDYVLNEVSVVTKEEEAFAAITRGLMEKLEKGLADRGFKMPLTGAQLRMAAIPDFLRTVTFHAFLGGCNPIQIVMQGLNGANAVMISPVHGAKAVANATALRVALMSDREEVWRHLANTHNVATLGLANADEFVETVKALRRSGLLDGINSTSLYGAEAGKYGLFNRGTRAAGGVSTAPFNRGEEFSRIVSFDVARREWMAANKGADWTTDAALNKILERQDDLTQNMTNANRATWQKGLGAIPTQFMAYPIRFTLNTLYSITGTTNRAFSQKEALSLLLGSALIYGVSGTFGESDTVYEMFGAAAEGLDENERLAVQQGVIAAFINVASKELTGEELQLAFGKRFGALGGVNNAVAAMVEWAMGNADAVDFRDLLLGASGGALDRIFGNASLAVKLFWHNKDDITEDTIIEGTKLLATGAFSSLNNIQKAYIAEKNFMRVSSGKGQYLYGANSNELAAMRLGFTLNGEYEYSLMMKNDKARKNHYQDMAKEIGRLQVLALTAHRSGDKDAYTQYSNAIHAIRAAHDDPLERQQLLEEMHKVWPNSKQRELLIQEIVSNKRTPLLVENGKENVQ